MSAHLHNDTIAAIATAPGRGGIGVIRISGALAPALLSSICGRLPQPRLATLLDFHECGTQTSRQVLDRGIALYFPAPHSFTGEDVAELQAHGGPVVLDLLLQEIIRLGARLARPGEFSERAYLNNKLDLIQAEAIADLIDSSSRQAARNAMRSLQGAFSARVNELLEDLTGLRVYVEASIDFPEEEVNFLADLQVAARLDTLLEKLGDVRHTARNGVLLRDGMTLVLAGKPNAGKSSLMNQLAGRDTAIVTAIPGTTRDLLREQITLDGLPLHIIDTAGLRSSPDEIEREGVRRAIGEIRRADRLLLVIDSSSNDCPQQILAENFGEFIDELPPITVLMNKCDLVAATPAIELGGQYPIITLSALSGTGLELLREHLKQSVGYQHADSGDFSARRRHLDALERTHSALLDAKQQWHAGELLAEHLREAQQALGEITGEFTPDDLLGQIFSSFCIGK